MINVEEEFKLRREKLGKRKAVGREGFLLRKILEKPFPLILQSEPIEDSPESAGWLYYNPEVILPVINNLTLKNYLTCIDNILLKCWEHQEKYSKRKIQPEPWIKFWVFDNIEFFSYLKNCDIKLNEEAIMTQEQAKTILHYYRFGISDYKENLWEKRKNDI